MSDEREDQNLEDSRWEYRARVEVIIEYELQAEFYIVSSKAAVEGEVEAQSRLEATGKALADAKEKAQDLEAVQGQLMIPLGAKVIKITVSPDREIELTYLESKPTN